MRGTSGDDDRLAGSIESITAKLAMYARGPIPKVGNGSSADRVDAFDPRRIAAVRKRLDLARRRNDREGMLLAIREVVNLFPTTMGIASPPGPYGDDEDQLRRATARPSSRSAFAATFVRVIAVMVVLAAVLGGLAALPKAAGQFVWPSSLAQGDDRNETAQTAESELAGTTRDQDRDVR